MRGRSMAVRKNGAKKNGWKIFIITLALVAIASGAFYIWTTIQHFRTVNKYEEALSSYFKFRAEDNKEGLASVAAGDFEDELSSINFKGSGYSLYEYNFTDDNYTNKMNEILQVKKITFGVTLNENNNPVSYIGEAYLTNKDNKIKIVYIKKLYKGKNITKVGKNRDFKV
jgi:hypothetical protein